MQWKSGLRGVAFLEGDNLVVFCNLSASEIWPDKRGGFWLEWPYMREMTVLSVIYTFFPLISPREHIYSKYRSLWHQTHYDVTDKNNYITIESLYKHYDWYNSSSFQIHCDTSYNVCLGLHHSADILYIHIKYTKYHSVISFYNALLQSSDCMFSKTT